MYSSESRQYIFKQSAGKMWNFYHDNKQGLIYSIMTKRNTWTDPAVLQKDTYKSFFADIDYEDSFHILFQDNKGNISYSLVDNGSAITVPVLKSKAPAVYNKHLHLIPFKKSNVHFFYTLQHNESMILGHQILAGGKLGNPRVVDYVSGNSCPYSVVCDKSSGIYAFYQLSDGKHLQLGYKKYLPAQKNWTEFTSITSHSDDCEFPRALADGKNIIHLCYQRRVSKQYELVYQQKIPDKNIWTNDVIIHTSAYPFHEASILCINETMIIYWIRDDIIYYSSSNDSGSTWSKPTRYGFPYVRQLVCMSYKTNSPYENEKVIVRDIPGSFVNGLKMAFYQDAAGGDNNLTADELKNMIVESLKLLKGSVEELKESDISLKAEILDLRTSQEQLEKEVTKYSLKLNLAENQINQAKSINSRFESLKGDMDEVKSRLEKEAPDPDQLKSSILAEISGNSETKKILLEIQKLKNEISELKKTYSSRKLGIKRYSSVKRYINKEAKIE